jgi:hypothetical protein
VSSIVFVFFLLLFPVGVGVGVSSFKTFLSFQFVF